MSDYSNTFNGANKDATNATIFGADFDTEFNNIASMSTTKADKVLTPVDNNILVMDASGNLQDGGLQVSTLWHSGNDGAGSGLDADLLDGLDSTQFLRSDQSGVVTSTHLAVDSVTNSAVAANAINTAEIADLAVTTAKLADANVTQAKIASASVGQGQLKTATGSVSTTSTSWTFLTLPGGSYGMYPRLSETGDGIRASLAATYLNSSSYVTNISIAANTTGTVYAQQRYFTASPPYDLGDGSVPLFLFAIIENADGVVNSIYIAQEAPWHYNGPTQVKADVYRNGKSYRFRRDMSSAPFTYDEAKSDPAKLAEYMAAFRAAPIIEEEITQEIKQADMPLIPHPFMGNDLTGKTVVMLDPVSDLCHCLFEMHEQHDACNVAELLHEGYIQVDNNPLNRAGPPGVPVVGFKWKNTGGK